MHVGKNKLTDKGTEHKVLSGDGYETEKADVITYVTLFVVKSVASVVALC